MLALLLLCVAALVGIVAIMSTSVRGPSVRGTERRLTAQFFGSPEDKSRAYQQGLHLGAQAQPQNVDLDAPQEGGGFSNGGTSNLPPGVQFGHSSGNPLDSIFGSTHALSPGTVAIPILQIIFTIAYYFMVVKHYPYLERATPLSSQVQNQFALLATFSASWQNCVLSWCCPQARAAHTFSRTVTFDYWFSCIAMFLCPCCTLCYANTCTDLNAKMGGERVSVIWSSLSACCCPCCVIAQDAESLDLATGVHTDLTGVKPGVGQYGMQPMPMASGATGTGTGVSMGTVGTAGSGAPFLTGSNPALSGPGGSGVPFVGGSQMGMGPMGTGMPYGGGAMGSGMPYRPY